MSKTMKVSCEQCGWNGTTQEQLKAHSPFEPEDIIIGCPKCKNVGEFYTACDYDGCWEPVGMGVPLKDGRYVFRCHKHDPTEEERR